MSEAKKLSDPVRPLFPQGASPAEAPAEPPSVARARAFLERVPALNRRIDLKLQQQDQLRRLITRAVSPALPGVPSDEEGRSALLARFGALEREISRDIDHLCNLKREVQRQLSALEHPRAARMLEALYLQGLTLTQAAARCGCCFRHAQKLRRQGLLELDRLLQEDPPATGYLPPLP